MLCLCENLGLCQKQIKVFPVLEKSQAYDWVFLKVLYF